MIRTKFHSHVNSIPQFTLPVEDDGETFHVHFAALFSPNPAATPIIITHGWPGCFFEFLPMLNNVAKAWSRKPEAFPYHVIVPDMPGYIFSSAGVKTDITYASVTSVLHKLMMQLGFGPGGYIAQGGDVGAGIARMMALNYDECRGALLNMLPAAPPENAAELAPPTATERKAMARVQAFMEHGTSYAMIQGTRPSTIGLALASSPQALLAW